jgi:isoquinoline 1-oxidoreductase beta subunit
MSMQRRTVVLAGLGAAGALLVGWAVAPVGQRQRGGKPLRTAEGELAPNAWLKIDRDDRVTIIVPRIEMGQGAQTGLAMLVAEELDADWTRVRIEAAPFDPVYNNLAVVSNGLPFQPDDRSALPRAARHLADKAVRHVGAMVTGGSTSLEDLWLPMREAGAYARALLIALAAERWQVPVDACSVRAGVVQHPQHEGLRFGALVDRLGGRSPESVLPRASFDVAAGRLKDAAQRGLLGRRPMRLDTPSKVDGSAVFAADVHEPGMAYAALEFAPQRDATLRSVDASGALLLRDVERVFSIPAIGGAAAAVVVIARSRHAAWRARAALRIDWQPGASVSLDDGVVAQTLTRALADPDEGYAYRDDGDALRILADASSHERTLEAEYEVPYLAHAAMESPCCAIRFDGDRARVIAGVQIPDLCCKAVATVLGIAPEAVRFEQAYIGGAFGRRLEHDFVLQAAAIAREVPQRLVQLQWRREDDLRQDFYRPATRARLRAALDAQGRVIAWHGRSVGQSIVAQAAPRVFGVPVAGPDKTTVEGAYDMPYEIDALRVAHRNVELPVRVGFWRSVGHSFQGFFVETFMDELAQRAGIDPVEFRARHLAKHPRQLAVLRKVAAASSWATPPAPAADGARIARGVALVCSFGSVVAQVAEVSLDRDGRPRVHRVVVAIDCGTPVHPGLIAQQMEGAVAYGLSAALRGEISFAGGAVQQGNFDGYPALRLAEAPAVETYIMPSDAPPSGVGEPGLPPIAPAVANALAVLTGQRARKLPLGGVSGIVRGLSAGA